MADSMHEHSRPQVDIDRRGRILLVYETWPTLTEFQEDIGSPSTTRLGTRIDGQWFGPDGGPVGQPYTLVLPDPPAWSNDDPHRWVLLPRAIDPILKLTGNGSGMLGWQHSALQSTDYGIYNEQGPVAYFLDNTGRPLETDQGAFQMGTQAFCITDFTVTGRMHSSNYVFAWSTLDGLFGESDQLPFSEWIGGMPDWSLSLACWEDLSFAVVQSLTRTTNDDPVRHSRLRAGILRWDRQDSDPLGWVLDDPWNNGPDIEPVRYENTATGRIDQYSGQALAVSDDEFVVIESTASPAVDEANNGVYLLRFSKESPDLLAKIRLDEPQDGRLVFEPTASISRDKTQIVVVWWTQDRATGENHLRAARIDTQTWQRLPWAEANGALEIQVDASGREPKHDTRPVWEHTFYPVATDPYWHEKEPPPRTSVSVAGPGPDGTVVFAWTNQSGDPSMPAFPVRNQAVMRCFDGQGQSFYCGVDRDEDGYLDRYDCDEQNPYLGPDLDHDGRCDWLLGPESACVAACSVHETSSARSACEDQCRHPDNCPCTGADCPDDQAQSEADDLYRQTCHEYWLCIRRGETGCDDDWAADLCQQAFANPVQADEDGNGRGDKCDIQARMHFLAYDKGGDAQSFGNVLGYCSDSRVDVEVALEGGSLPTFTWTPQEQRPHLVWHDLAQRTWVGACGCTDDQIHSGACTSICPHTSERLDGKLAWEPIQGPQMPGMPNVGDADACPNCPRFLDQAEPQPPAVQNWRSWLINKYLTFSHDSSANRSAFTWDWTKATWTPTHKQVWLRGAWQSPQATRYTYHDPGVHRLAYTQQTRVLDPNCITAEVPWRQLSTLTLVVKPWGYTDPPREAPQPWHLAVTDDGRYEMLDHGQDLSLADLREVQVQAAPGRAATLSAGIAASGMVEGSLLGMDDQLAPRLFHYFVEAAGGPVAAPVARLFVADPQAPQPVWTEASLLLGDTANPPALDDPALVWDARRQRLLLLGRPGGEDAAWSLWLLSLRDGRWKGPLALPVDWPAGRLLTAQDPLRHRALILPTGGQGRLWRLSLDDLSLSPASEPLAPGAALVPAAMTLDRLSGRVSLAASWPTVQGWSLFRLEPGGNEWQLVSEAEGGPALSQGAFLVADPALGRVQLADASGNFWSLSGGRWEPPTQELLTQGDDWSLDGTYQPGARDRFLATSAPTEPPGRLLLARLTGGQGLLGLTVADSHGRMLNQSLQNEDPVSLAFFNQNTSFLHLVAQSQDSQPPEISYHLELHPAQFEPVASWSSDWPATSALARGATAYLASGRKLSLLDISDPAHPAFMRRKGTGGLVQDMAWCDGLICVARTHPRKGLVAYDPSSPGLRKAASARTRGLVRDLAAQGRLVATAEGLAGAAVWRREDRRFRVQQRLAQDRFVTAVALSGDILAVASAFPNRIALYRISTPGGPTLMAETEAEGWVGGMEFRAGLLYASRLDDWSWPACLVGLACLPGDQVTVFAFSDGRLSRLDQIQDETARQVGNQLDADLLLVPDCTGLTIYQARWEGGTQ